MEEILSRLPVKSLLRFKCVSKSWLSLISTQRFIKSNGHNSTKNRVVINESKDGIFKQFSLQQLLNEPSSMEPSPIYEPMNHQLLTKEADVVGCCNGLMCILNQSGFHLWNPATMISKELPKFESPLRKIGFGWDGTSGAYKVFAEPYHEFGHKGIVYSSKTKSWKTVYRGYHGVGVHDIFGVFACGKIHWLMIGEDYFEFFDLESEVFGRIELPFKPPNYWELYYKVAEIEGFLHLVFVQQSYVDVWVMKGSCWLKLATLTKFPFFVPNYFDNPLLVVEEGPNGEILLISGNSFLIYSPKDVTEGKTRTEFHDGHVYVESLVSPNFNTLFA